MDYMLRSVIYSPGRRRCQESNGGDRVYVQEDDGKARVQTAKTPLGISPVCGALALRSFFPYVQDVEYMMNSKQSVVGGSRVNAFAKHAWGGVCWR